MSFFSDKNMKMKREITKESIEKILRKGGVHIEVSSDTEIWKKAFIHRSCIESKERKKVSKNSNERYEWLGDNIISTIISCHIFTLFPEEDEGFMTILRSRLVRSRTLRILCDKLGLFSYLVVSNNKRINIEKAKEDLFESFVGALYYYFTKVSKGHAYNIANKFVSNVFEKYIDIRALSRNCDIDSKGKLISLCQKKYHARPLYAMTKNEKKKTFTIEVKHPITHEIVGIGCSKKKKRAEQIASKQALSICE